VTLVKRRFDVVFKRGWALLLCVFGCVSQCEAAQHVWSGAVDGKWSNAGNWASGGAPTSIETNVSLLFPSSGITYLTTNDLSNLSLSYVEIQEHGYTLGGNALEVSGDISMTALGPSAAAVAFPMSLTAGSHVFNVSSTGAVLSLSNVISSSGSVVKTGAGRLELSGSNTYDGATDVVAGTLKVRSSGALGSVSGGTVVHDGASLVLAPFSAASFNESLLLEGQGDGGAGALQISPTVLQISGPIALASPETLIVVEASTTVELRTSIQGPGGLKKTGAGWLSFAGGPNTYAGSTYISGGATLSYAQSPPAIPHDLTIVDGTFKATSQPSQLSPSSTVYVGSGASTGYFWNDSWGTITIASLVTTGGTVEVSGGSGLVINGDVTALPSAYTSTIGGVGNLALGPFPHTFTVSSGAALTVSAAFSGDSVGIQKAGPGPLTLSGDNTYSGPTSVAMGSLFVNGSQPLSNAVVNGGVLGGTGTVRNITANSGGTVSPGNSPGVLKAGPAFTLNSGSTLAIELNGTMPGSGYDQLNVTGTVSLAGSLTVSASQIFASSTQFVILSNDGGDAVTGTFAGLPEGAGILAGGNELRVSYLGIDGSTGNDVVLTTLPPPSASISPPASTYACPSVSLSASAAGGTTSYASYQWYRNGVPLSGATSQMFDAVLAGSYTMTVTDSLGVTSSTSPPVFITGDGAAPTVTAPAGASVTQTTCG